MSHRRLQIDTLCCRHCAAHAERAWTVYTLYVRFIATTRFSGPHLRDAKHLWKHHISHLMYSLCIFQTYVLRAHWNSRLCSNITKCAHENVLTSTSNSKNIIIFLFSWSRRNFGFSQAFLTLPQHVRKSLQISNFASTNPKHEPVDSTTPSSNCTFLFYHLSYFTSRNLAFHDAYLYSTITTSACWTFNGIFFQNSNFASCGRNTTLIGCIFSLRKLCG